MGFTDDPQATATLFTQELLDRGFLASRSFYPSFAHTDAQIDSYLAAVDEVFVDLADAVSTGSVLQRLRGPVAQSGFTRLTYMSLLSRPISRGFRTVWRGIVRGLWSVFPSREFNPPYGRRPPRF